MYFSPPKRSVNSKLDKSLILCAGFDGTTSVWPSERGNTSRKAPQFSPRPTKLPGTSPDSIFWNRVGSAIVLADNMPLKVLRVVFALKRRERVSNCPLCPCELLVSKFFHRYQQEYDESVLGLILHNRTLCGSLGFLYEILRFLSLLWQDGFLPSILSLIHI